MDEKIRRADKTPQRRGVDKKRTIIMTKLAIYDKHFGPNDRKDNEYFRHDYIYRKNMRTRFCAMTAAVILILLRWLYKIAVEHVDILTIDYQKAGTDAAVFILAVMILYTLIGTIIYTNEYARSQERLKDYTRLLNILDHTRRQSDLDKQEEDLNLYYEADTASKRDSHSLI